VTAACAVRGPGGFWARAGTCGTMTAVPTSPTSPGSYVGTGPSRHPARLRAARAALAVVLLGAGVIFGVFYRIADGRENHSYNRGATPHFPVHVTLGKQYELSTPGGGSALVRQGLLVSTIRCTWSGNGTQSDLGITSLAGQRTVHAFATFVGPTTGAVTIRCEGVPSLFVDDADDARADPAGLFVLLATIALTAGAALGLSELYRRASTRSVGRPFGVASGSAPRHASPLETPPEDRQ